MLTSFIHIQLNSVLSILFLIDETMKADQIIRGWILCDSASESSFIVYRVVYDRIENLPVNIFACSHSHSLHYCHPKDFRCYWCYNHNMCDICVTNNAKYFDEVDGGTLPVHDNIYWAAELKMRCRMNTYSNEFFGEQIILKSNIYTNRV